MSDKKLEFHRILLKISGEALGGPDGAGIDSATIDIVSKQIADLVHMGKQIAVVMGAGNLFRGVMGVASGMDQVVGDQMGMLATVMNALALRENLRKIGLQATMLSALPVPGMVEKFSALDGRAILEDGDVVLCPGGTGNPYFTTDTAAVLRALELKCDAMFKATKVDGVYDKDPIKYNDAVKFDTITYTEILLRELKVMDLTAIALAGERKLPVVVFNLRREGMLLRVAGGDLSEATLITG
jgi:uridylate kinase